MVPPSFHFPTTFFPILYPVINPRRPLPSFSSRVILARVRQGWTRRNHGFCESGCNGIPSPSIRWSNRTVRRIIGGDMMELGRRALQTREDGIPGGRGPFYLVDQGNMIVLDFVYQTQVELAAETG
ncbi:hypothetical protein MLD38_004529 [Melastoma candidum]|uniref:Uncharacterized protein n=1 Tax=Melastoma candidum TaxID=119954 RepID=A0ACB9S582_9MYRT|nr:hypothetical protein MLD38_004529 [Melastoma candidum]